MSDTSPSSLGDYVHVKHGYAFKSDHFTDEVTPNILVTPGNFAIGGGFQEHKLRYYAGPVPDDYFLESGALVVTMTDLSKAGDTLGFPALIPESAGSRYLHNQRIGRVEIKDGIEADSRFLFYRLRADDYRHHVLATATGSTVRHTSPGRICDFQTTLPEIDDQRAIAGVLGALDDKIEHNRRTAQALERLARAIFRAWFVDFEPVKAKVAGATAFPSMPQAVFDALPTRFIDSEIGPVPKGWDAKPFSSACIIVSGGTPKRSEPSYWNGEVPWYSVKDATDDGEVWVINTDERITEAGVSNSAARMVPKGCTIISARGTVGKLAMAGKPMTFNQSCYGLLPADRASFSYLHLLTQTAVAGLKQRTHGSVFDTITRATFDGLLVVAPKLAIVSSFEEIVAPFFDVLLASRQESAMLVEVRNYLLPRLLNGSVRVEPVNG
ncbi:restriction endonuclease subunit S [Accumulibacter sp.]|uniref:restriction endonuclease subunit S n=1 Tax=Accumulibacter sp. TaxID=2053492 RepID=UPI0028C46788|nr:restriction endonuclease subunit S [Accumulibacter sp.]